MSDTANTNEGPVKKAFRGLWEGLKDVAGDLTTLEVITTSGEFNLLVDKTPPKQGDKDQTTKYNLKNSDAVLDLIANAKPGEENKVYLVAYTRIDFDHDTVNFVNANPTEEDKRLYTLHVESIKAAQEARAAFINMLAGIFKG